MRQRFGLDTRKLDVDCPLCLDPVSSDRGYMCFGCLGDVAHAACVLCIGKHFVQATDQNSAWPAWYGIGISALSCPKCRAPWTREQYDDLLFVLRRKDLTLEKCRGILRDEAAETRRQQAAVVQPPAQLAIRPPEYMTWVCCQTIMILRDRGGRHYEVESDYMTWSTQDQRGICMCQVCGNSIDVVGPRRDNNPWCNFPSQAWSQCGSCGPRGVLTCLKSGCRWWSCWSCT